ncbi:MAG: hypothetical protein BWY99_02081 [Synergistetes bacterium ADurb.BinA166]|nr:MAG: hypothetical protein BWY99_02081 [Synergistetes bacterium ADurb.BinA166]
MDEKYELWEAKKEGEATALSFFPESNGSARALLEPEAVLIWTCEAPSRAEACKKRNKFLGWAPYVEMP